MADQPVGPGLTRPMPFLPGSNSMRSLLDSGPSGIFHAAKAAHHDAMLPGLMKGGAKAQGEANRVLPNRASFQSEKPKGFTVGAEVVHPGTHQRVVITKAGVGQTRMGEPVHLVKTSRGDLVQVPERNLQLME